MVTMTKWGDFGRLGNQLFQWAFLSSLARKHNVELILPKSNLFLYFESKPKTGKINCPVTVREPHYQYDPRPYENLDYRKDIDFLGYWQNEKYFDSEVRKEIKFSKDFKYTVGQKFRHLFDRETIAIGVRRTDYLTLPYYNLPPVYYITALQKHFPDWRNCNLIFISDDLPYCKFHFGCLENAHFPQSKDIEQLCLMSLCDNFILANSTFHWWGAYLGEKEGTKVVQPNHLFKDSLLQKYGDINFNSLRWETHEHEGKKIDLSDVTFTIPVSHDHPDRKFNLDLCITLLNKEFKTNIIIGENGDNKFEYTKQWVKYRRFNYPKFHRTKMLNEMAKMANTPFVANWDCDVAVPPMQLLETVTKLRMGAGMVYPYDGIFHRIRKKENHRIFPRYDLGDFSDLPPNGTPSVGGAVLWNKNVFFEIGGENEYMVSYAPEDVERIERATKLGVRIERAKGDLIHFDHWCGPDSSSANPDFRKNKDLLTIQREMTEKQLRDYINSWPWHTPYTGDYYDGIVDDSTRSRDAIFPIVGVKGSIVDVGCGIGQWGVGLERYTGIDFRIPKDKLLVKDYIEQDIRKPFDIDKRFDLVLCLEVAEHLEEEYADILVDNLCKLGDKILFSAAIPYQGGNNHVNEQWQTYWAEKFALMGYGGRMIKEVREANDACLWYRQNTVIYEKDAKGGSVEDYVLPEYYIQIVKHLKG